MPERRVVYEVVSRGQLSGVSLQAPSMQRLFIDAALALSDYRVSLDLVKEKEKEKLSVVGTDLKDLLVHWLDAVSALYSTKQFLAYRIVFNQFDGKKIDATLMGEKYESARHGFARAFQATSPGSLELKEEDGGFRLHCLLK